MTRRIRDMVSSFESDSTLFLDQIIENSGVTCYCPVAAVQDARRDRGGLGLIRFSFARKLSNRLVLSIYRAGSLAHTGRPETERLRFRFFLSHSSFHHLVLE